MTEQFVTQSYHFAFCLGIVVLAIECLASWLTLQPGAQAAYNRNEMMKSLSLLLAALLAVPLHAIAADAVKIDVYLAGALKQSVSLVGPNSIVKFSPSGIPGTTLELRLIAPEPVIIEMTETTTDDGGSEVVGRVKMPTPGGSVAVSEVKGAKYHGAYVLVRRD